MGNFYLYFNGYWTEDHIQGIPQKSGIYLVYRCVPENNMVTLKELIYIGQAGDLRNRINTHDKKELFIDKCLLGETLCYSVAEVSENDLDIVENALIFAQKPPLNDLYTDRFNYPIPASFRLDGRCTLMKHQNFTIE